MFQYFHNYKNNIFVFINIIYSLKSQIPKICFEDKCVLFPNDFDIIFELKITRLNKKD